MRSFLFFGTILILKVVLHAAELPLKFKSNPQPWQDAYRAPGVKSTHQIYEWGVGFLIN